VISLIQQGPFALFAAFIVMHTLADFPLQGDYIAKQKARRHADSKSAWVVALMAHGIIHGGGVWLVSGSLVLGCVEMFLHALIDFGKGEERFGLVADQLMHVSCKLAYTLMLFYGWVSL
jgi:hypothetical protein